MYILLKFVFQNCFKMHNLKFLASEILFDVYFYNFSIKFIKFLFFSFLNILKLYLFFLVFFPLFLYLLYQNHYLMYDFNDFYNHTLKLWILLFFTCPKSLFFDFYISIFDKNSIHYEVFYLLLSFKGKAMLVDLGIFLNSLLEYSYFII